MARSHNLDLRNLIGNTALCFAAASGTVAIARVMVEAHEGNLPMISNNQGLTPLLMAAILGHRDMVDYLLDCTTGLSDTELVSILLSIINTDLYG
ncbi:hypothetical protein RND81_14G090400 [Saponaria officinalis]|uniref:Ankyrin repeat protein n=1 Tax=Saponaria officinalis TaxID=3572 RepID=A0AAW1GK61_SAPOF